jgi:hypothetical protein
VGVDVTRRHAPGKLTSSSGFQNVATDAGTASISCATRENPAYVIVGFSAHSCFTRENFASSDFSLYTASPIEQTVVEQGGQGVDQTFRRAAFRFGLRDFY